MKSNLESVLSILNPKEVSLRLSKELSQLSFAAPVSHVYDPLTYAWSLHAQYLERYAVGTKRFLLLGMNPGPYGMAQTGVPFGDPFLVKDPLQLTAEVSRPAAQHPKRPILGLASPRHEVSGQRVWSWVVDQFGSPAAFAEQFVIANYCPLCFLEDGGKNRTPDKLKAKERAAVYAACDTALRARIAYHRPEWVIGIGAFAEARARNVVADTAINVGRILHPSPASPIANRGWAPQATAQLQALGILAKA
jgi:single-strand selective monofunctional uracil DNA glycosylase